AEEIFRGFRSPRSTFPSPGHRLVSPVGECVPLGLVCPDGISLGDQWGQECRAGSVVVGSLSARFTEAQGGGSDHRLPDPRRAWGLAPLRGDGDRANTFA